LRENKGRLHVIQLAQIRETDRILQGDLEIRKLIWQELGWEASLEGISSKTLQQTIGFLMNYRRCIPCRKGWVIKSIARYRVEYY